MTNNILNAAITNFIDEVFKNSSQDEKDKLSMELSDTIENIKEKCRSNKEKWVTKPKL